MIPVCPKCDEGLLILNFKELEVDFCHRCRGLWLDAGELEELMQRTGASADDPLLQFQRQKGAPVEGRKHLCPRCDSRLNEIVMSGPEPGAAAAHGAGGALTLDRCPRGHGLWFDAMELRQLLAMFPPESGSSKTVAFLNDFFGAKPKPQP